MSYKWMIIYPMGNKNLLDIAHVLDYEIDEWSLASFKEFKEEKDAAAYAQKLSKQHGIPMEARPNSKLLHILDLEEPNE
jgi:hypothetical protein